MYELFKNSKKIFKNLFIHPKFQNLFSKNKTLLYSTIPSSTVPDTFCVIIFGENIQYSTAMSDDEYNN